MDRSLRSSVLPLLWQAALYDPSGYSEEARCVVYACESMNVAITARDWPAFRPTAVLSAANQTVLDKACQRAEPDVPYVEVIHKTIPPASRATLYPQTGPTVLRTMFETDSLPEGWAAIVNRFDRVWVPGSFNLETFERAGVPHDKLARLPETLDFATLLAPDVPFEMPDEIRGFRFLTVFEFTERKGWRLLLDAWADAFDPTDDVSLIIKCSFLVMGVTEPEARIKAHLSGRRTAPIVVLAKYLSSASMASLYHACDGFVLPTRGEGWGRPLMEAMAVGLPTIGSKWSGNTEFMSPTNSFLIEGDLVPITSNDLVFERYVGQNWFEPDREQLARMLRTVAERSQSVSERAARGAHEVRTNFSHARFVARLKELVAEALTGW